ncbi:MAG: segregation/condensation protein A [Microcoleus sp. PH2017_01_SCD_O_A]|uniref:segregation/condensation protein A n=1 Tax=Microcoleus sp. PH2017_01_SCD_O_A TaxID=2798812 RepID=UPI001E012905|nr:segregation/condensation protein A [Microcoleus sp. PH2017_01_SCD_O_A]MCC3426524.1 segregation/condensation protein A [Microcoleus sp. PH2017_01_SCD_O_A]TAG01215.1 MAG: segregation/condensation protein A [Oscillatoriales cyanobacterium]TAG63839.1 MAG: segregation/condensation protein A [Oscillatoriales cyanobacterium]TAG70471.1 MAG: segregation/condensation protein A [Oscillatoriales cyanobacterium]
MVVSRDQDGLETISEGIAILIDLAERGEIDPWDVKVIEVFDRCLSKLTNASDADQSSDFSDLSHSGQAFLYASMLVLLKAESIVLCEPPPNPELDEAALEDTEHSGGRNMPQHLERQLRRRGVAQLPQKRPVTLPELIEQLQLMKAAMEQTVAPRRRPTSKMRSQAAQAIFELAHQENLVETASELDRFLAERGQEIDEGWLDLDKLLELWHHHGFNSSVHPDPPLSTEEVHLPNYDRVGVFWALLLLSAQSKVELLQEEFYQDLKIRAL